MTSREGAANAALAANGSLIYVPGAIGGAGRRTVVSVDRQGRVSPLPGLPLDSYRDVRVSPDGARLALSSDNGVATYDVARAAVSALTTDTARELSPLWTPDSDRIVYSSNPGGHPELFWRPADGSASGQRLLTRGKDVLDLLANGWAPDRQLLFTEVPGSVRCAIGQVAIAPASEGKLLLKNEVCNAHAALSPNGRWIAYRSRRVAVETRSMSNGIRRSETASRSRAVAGRYQPGRVTARSCSSSVWTPSRCIRSQCRPE